MDPIFGLLQIVLLSLLFWFLGKRKQRKQHEAAEEPQASPTASHARARPSEAKDKPTAKLPPPIHKNIKAQEPAAVQQEESQKQTVKRLPQFSALQLVLMHEILSKPKSLRPPDEFD